MATAMTAEYIRGRPLPYLKAWRMRRYMGQAELARASALGKSTIVRAERGDEVVSWPNIRKLAEALNTTADELVGTDPDAPQS